MLCDSLIFPSAFRRFYKCLSAHYVYIINCSCWNTYFFEFMENTGERHKFDADSKWIIAWFSKLSLSDFDIQSFFLILHIHNDKEINWKKQKKRAKGPKFAFGKRSRKTNSIPGYSNRTGNFYQIPFTSTFPLFSFEHLDVAVQHCWFQCVAEDIIKSRILLWLLLRYMHLPAAARWWAAKTVQPCESLWVEQHAHVLGAFLDSSWNCQQ